MVTKEEVDAKMFEWLKARTAEEFQILAGQLKTLLEAHLDQR